MLESIVDFIGRLLSKIFGIFTKIGDGVEDVRRATSGAGKVVSQAKTTLSVSVTGESHVNYFRGRIVGEFIKVLSLFAPTKYDPKTGAYVAYFMRKSTKTCVEYLKFYKDTETSDVTHIAYYRQNKLISKKGTTFLLGTNDSSNLSTDDNVIKCVSETLSGRAPMYLCHEEPRVNVSVGSPMFFTGIWAVTIRAVQNRVQKYLDGDEEVKKDVESITSKAGLHLFMSFFKSFKEPMMDAGYGKCSITRVADGVTNYNKGHFNTQKILEFKYSKEATGESISAIEGSKDVKLVYHGTELRVTNCSTNETPKVLATRLNRKVADSLLLSDDRNLARNFLFFIMATGVSDMADIIHECRTEMNDAVGYPDAEVDTLNENVEPVVTKVMYDTGFTVDDKGEFVSDVFKRETDVYMSSMVRPENDTVPDSDVVIETVPVSEITSIRKRVGMPAPTVIDVEPVQTGPDDDSGEKSNIDSLLEAAEKQPEVEEVADETPNRAEEESSTGDNIEELVKMARGLGND